MIRIFIIYIALSIIYYRQFGRNAITYLAAKISAPSMPKSTICRTVSFLSKGVLQPVDCAVLD